MCGASAARVHDFSAGYYNPAGLTLARTPEASFGVLGFGSQLHDRERRPHAPRPSAIRSASSIGAATPIPFGGVLRDRALHRRRALHRARHHRARDRARARRRRSFRSTTTARSGWSCCRRWRRGCGAASRSGIAFNYLAGARRQRVADRGRHARDRGARRRGDLLAPGGERRRALAVRRAAGARRSSTAQAFGVPFQHRLAQHGRRPADRSRRRRRGAVHAARARARRRAGKLPRGCSRRSTCVVALVRLARART